jgi:ABC-type multidrug transport system ATPase subunit
LNPILEVSGLSKAFGSFQAVSDLSFEVHPGDIYGFLGQNGAGKSTTMRMILGLIHPDAGVVRIKGTEFNTGNRQLLRHVGAIIERPDMYGYLSGLDNLKIFARLNGLKLNTAGFDALLELVSLKGREHDKVKAYSQGMKQRLGIAIALVHNPDILILDEPTNGLDPQGIASMRELILRLAHERGKTVIISSHLLHEVEQVANRMIIIHKGKKIREGAVAELLRPEDTLMDIRFTPDPDIAAQLRLDSRWAGHIEQSDDSKIVLTMHPELAPELSRWLIEHNANLLSMQARHSLEAYFLSLTHDAAAAH